MRNMTKDISMKIEDRQGEAEVEETESVKAGTRRALYTEDWSAER